MTPTDECAQNPRPSGPFGLAIFEMERARDMAQQNHDAALRQERYLDAARLNERIKSFSKAHHLLTAADSIHTTK